MKALAFVAVAALCVAANAEQEVFRLVRDTETGTTCVVGVDGVMRPCHLLTDSEFYFVTNMVFKWTAYMNSSKEGRRALHGEKDGGVEVTTNGVGVIVKRQRYEDGYVHEETARVVNRPKKKIDAVLVAPTKPPTPTFRHPSGISEKQRKMREARERIRQKKPKEVTVNHDANTGKDTVVE